MSVVEEQNRRSNGRGPTPDATVLIASALSSVARLTEDLRAIQQLVGRLPAGPLPEPAPVQEGCRVFFNGTTRVCNATELGRLKAQRYDLCLDLDQQAILRCGCRTPHVAKLPPLAQAMLCYLAARPDSFLSIEDVYSRVGYEPANPAQFNPIHKAILELRTLMGNHDWISRQRNCVVGGSTAVTRYAFTPRHRRYLLVFPEVARKADFRKVEVDSRPDGKTM